MQGNLPTALMCVFRLLSYDPRALMVRGALRSLVVVSVDRCRLTFRGRLPRGELTVVSLRSTWGM